MKFRNILSLSIATAGALVVGAALAPSMTAHAAKEATYIKNENVYGKLASDGEATGAYVVNSFTVLDDGEITDYGEYDSILNLTNLDEIEEDKDEYTFYADKGKFYYQGNIENPDLPWEFDISYMLDGKDKEPEEMAGETGDMEIHIKVKEAPEVEDAEFFNLYMLQVNLNLDNDLCENIEAENATIVDAGGDSKVVYTLMHNNFAEAENGEAEIVVKAEVEDFEMDDISINGSALQSWPHSFISGDNSFTGQTVFILSAEGVDKPEVKQTVTEDDEEKEGNFFEQMLDRIANQREV